MPEAHSTSPAEPMPERIWVRRDDSAIGPLEVSSVADPEGLARVEPGVWTEYSSYDEDSAGAELERMECDMMDLHDRLVDAGLDGAINAESIRERIDKLVAGRVEAWRDGFDAAWDLINVAASAGHAPRELPRAIANSRDVAEARYVEKQEANDAG